MLVLYGRLTFQPACVFRGLNKGLNCVCVRRARRTAKYQEALDGGHDVLVLVSEVWGGFSPEAMRFLGELAQARGDRVDFERESATWSTTSFMSYHGQMLSLAVQLGVATEIQNSIRHHSSKA